MQLIAALWTVLEPAARPNKIAGLKAKQDCKILFGGGFSSNQTKEFDTNQAKLLGLTR